MIKTVNILDIQNTAVKWLPEVKAFQERKVWEFTPGLNILWGANGTGKSSLLRLLARMFHCEQGQDEQKVTQHSVHEMFEWAKGSPLSITSKYDAVSVEHDSSPVIYLDPNATKGQIYAGSFDDDFFTASVASYMLKVSSGQTMASRLGSFLQQIADASFKSIPEVKIYDAKKKSAIEAFLAGTLEKDRPTVMLDEPDKSLDITTQVRFWNFIQRFQDKVQMIISAHSLLACDIPGANYITFGGDKYLKDCRLIKANISGTS